MAADSTSPIADLTSFIEDRLSVLIPGIDLSQGSPAQVQFVEPLIQKLGTDPFSTDIQSFLVDRFAQEFPDIYAGDPGVISDTFVKPLVLMLEPFKREIQNIMLNQSLQDPTVLSDDDADALVANIFKTRNSGGVSGGVARVYYANPTNVTIEVTTQFSTPDGLNFFPPNPLTVTAEEMVFNRDGSLFFADVPVIAEAAGAQYNIARNTLTSVTGLFGLVKVTNLADFTDGTPVVDTPTFVAQAQQSLNERSLVTRRGATAILDNVFQGDVAAIQVIGAGDPEMQRDILVATSPGQAWLTGQVSIYGSMAMVQGITVDDSSTTPSPAPGDTLYIYLDKHSYSNRWASLPQAQRFVRLNVVQVIAGPMQSSVSPFQVMYFVQFSDPNNLLPGLNLPTNAGSSQSTVVLYGGFTRVGTVAISSIPDTGAVDLVVNNQAVHVYGHSDVYARPTLQVTSQAIIDSLVDDNRGGKYFTLQSSTLQTYGATTGLENQVSDSTIDFELAGVQPGDLINIQNGNDAGTYVVGQVVGGNPSYLYLMSKLTTNATSIRYGVMHHLHLNWVEPKIPKLPFGTVPANDLLTVIGSTTFQFTAPTTDLVNYGAKIGDTIRILSGPDAGDFTITAIVSGQNVVVNRPTSASNSNLSYQVFTAQGALTLPLVRIKELSVLDSSQQTTGIDVPYGLPVAVVPTNDFTSALVRGSSQRNSGFVLPVWNEVPVSPTPADDFVTNGNVAATGTPSSTSIQQYSLGFAPHGSSDIYKAFAFDTNTHQTEFNFTNDMLTSPCSYFLATSEDQSQLVNYPPIDPKPGDALTLKTGPNAGSYIIQSVTKVPYDLGSAASPQPQAWLYFIKIYGSFPVDVFRQLIQFIDFNGGIDGGGTKVSKISTLSGQQVAFPSFFTTIFNNLGTYLNQALSYVGATAPTASALQTAVQAVTQVSYEWGDPARGTLRTYFVQPVLFQQNTALNPNPTLFNFELSNGNLIKFRPDPNLYQQYQLVPARLTSDTNPESYPRDLVPNPTTPTQVNFTSPTRSTMFAVGVQPGDTLNVFEEVFMLGSTGAQNLPTGTDHQIAVATTSGSTLLTALSSTAQSGHGPFNTSMVGDLLFIDEGVDTGGYTIVSVVGPDSNGYSYQITVDRPLGTTTPTDVTDGYGASTAYTGSVNQITVPGSMSLTAYINQYITIYGADTAYQGSYQISAAASAAGPTTVFTVNRGPATGNFATRSNYYWVITAAPVTPLAASSFGTGTVMYGLQAIRIYDTVPQIFPIQTVETDLDTPTTYQLVVSESLDLAASPELGINQPFVIYRPNVRRITPTEMSGNQQGFLYYFDTEVVSLGPEPTFNIAADTSYLTTQAGTFECNGYTMLVDDSTLSYSMKETGAIRIPPSILPVGSTDSQDNFLVLFGIPLLINYEQAPIIQQFQNFLDSADDRVVSANLLARHFLPTYVSYDASYTGGSAPSVVAQGIIDYINSLAIETPIEVSQLEKVIDDAGGDPQVPTTVFVSLHDWSRNIWVEFSNRQIGGTTTDVPYNGSARVSYFIPGPDVSGESPLPLGERINLTQS